MYKLFNHLLGPKRGRIMYNYYKCYYKYNYFLWSVTPCERIVGWRWRGDGQFDRIEAFLLSCAYCSSPMSSAQADWTPRLGWSCLSCRELHSLPATPPSATATAVATAIATGGGAIEVSDIHVWVEGATEAADSWHADRVKLVLWQERVL